MGKRAGDDARNKTDGGHADAGIGKEDAFLRTLMDKSLCATVVVDRDGTIRYVSQLMAAMLGYKPEERLGRNGADLLHPDDLPAANEALRKLARHDGATALKSMRVLHADGSWRTLEVLGRNLLDDTVVGGIVASFRDITDMMEQHEALRESEAKYAALVEHARDGVNVVQDGVMKFASRGIAEITGYTIEELVGMDFLQMVTPAHKGSTDERYQAYLKGKPPRSFNELEIRCKDGERKVIEASGTTIMFQGKPAILGVVRDITERKLAQEALAESDKLHRALVETAGVAGLGIMIIQNIGDVEGAIVFANDEYCRMSGYSREGLLGMSALTQMPLSERAAVAQRYRQRQGGEPVPDLYEATLLRKDGSLFPVETSATTMSYRGGLATVSFFRDISERKGTEAELAHYRDDLEAMVERRTADLRNANELLQRQISERERAEEAAALAALELGNVLENSVDMIYRANLGTGLYDYASPSTLRVLGYPPEEFTALGVFDAGALVHPDDWPMLTENVVKLLAGTESEREARTVEYRIKHRKLGYRWVSDGRSVVYDDANRPVAVVGNLRDVTDRRKAQEELEGLYQQEKALRKRVEDEMERRLDFTRALTHELKTPLTSVLASCDLLAAEVNSEPLVAIARNIGRGAARLEQRIDELLDVAMGEVGLLEVRVEPVDLPRLLRETAETMAPIISSRGQSIILKLPSFSHPVQADPARLQQVVTNLLSNAAKFSPRGGKIKLRAVERGDTAIVEVQDAGQGISEADQRLLFQPYRRLGSVGERLGGLGLGLYLCRTLVELHGGKLWVRSKPNKGSTFGFSLALDFGTPEADHPGKPASLWKVLAIEEEQSVVECIDLTLRTRWPEAELISAATTEEGVHLVDVEHPDVVIVDLAPPTEKGFGLLQQIRQLSAVPVIVLTVEGDESDMAKALECGADDYLIKPFRPLDLLARLKVHIRKRAPVEGGAAISFGPFRLDRSTLRLQYGDKEISLTAVEAKLLRELMKDAGHVVPYSRLAKAVWGEDYTGALETLRVHIHGLRHKLEEDPANPRIVRTKAGVGYSLAIPE